MAAQSMLMGDAFGKSYQYGKRKISAMTNEEFNALTPEDLAKDITADFNVIIPEMKIAMVQAREFQSLVIQELGEIVKSIPQELRNFIFGNDPNAPDTVLPVNPTPTDPLGDFILKHLPGFLSGTGIAVASANYNTLIGHLSNFFLGVSELNTTIINDAKKLVTDFVDTLNLDQFEEPIPNPTPEPAFEPTPTTEEQLASQISLEFLGSLIRDDFKTGGHRHRNFKGEIIHWNAVAQITTSKTSFQTNIYYWQNNQWTKQGNSLAFGSMPSVESKVNSLKISFGSAFVLEFNPVGTNTRWFYLINEVD